MKEIFKNFIKETETWYNSFPEKLQNRPCFLCGVTPKNQKTLSDELKSLNNK